MSSCMTTPITRARSAEAIVLTSRPLTRTSPRLGSSRPIIRCSSVVLPLPDGPVIATDSPGSTVRLAPLSSHGLSLP